MQLVHFWMILEDTYATKLANGLNENITEAKNLFNNLISYFKSLNRFFASVMFSFKPFASFVAQVSSISMVDLERCPFTHGRAQQCLTRQCDTRFVRYRNMVDYRRLFRMYRTKENCGLRIGVEHSVLQIEHLVLRFV